MMIHRVSLFTVFALAATIATIDAQDVVYRAAAPVAQTEGTFIQAIPPPEMGVIALDPISMGRPVVNAPYTAEAITEVTQALADGNRIEQRTSATVARDSRGRTRREQQGIALGSFVAQNARPIVTINDPTTGEHIMLNYDRKVAFRSKPVRMTFSNDPPRPPDADVTYGATVTMEIEAPGVPAPPPPPPPPPPGVMTWDTRVVGTSQVSMGGQISAASFEGEHHNETLEPRMIEGIRAEGTKTTVTIPAGAMGNTLPIEIVSEQWYSPELGVVMMTRRSDPRFGETVYRLTNVVRSEPAADLFKVPSGFRVQNMSRGGPLPVKPNEQ